MARHNLTVTLGEILFFVFFIFALAVYPGAIPNCGLIMTTISILTMLVMLLTQKNFKIKRRSAINYLLVLFWLNFISNMLAENEPVTYLFYAIQYTCIVVAIDIYCQNEERLDRMVKIIFWPIFLGGPIIGTIQLFSGEYLFGTATQEDIFFTTIISDARHSNPNYTALVMVMCVCLAGYLYTNRKKLIYLIAAVYSGICVTLTFSRTTIFVFAIGLIWLGFENFRRVKNIKTTIKLRSFIVLLVAIAVVVLIIPYAFQWVESYLEKANIEKLLQIKENSTIEQRVRQWGASVRIVLENGIGNFLFGFGDEAAEVLASVTFRKMTSHNLIFSSLSERGFLGVVFTLLIYGNFTIGILHCRKAAPIKRVWLYVAVAMILICYLMVSVLTWELYISIALGAVALEHQRNEERRLYETT